ncbi:DUF3054 domain-containing protein [Actinorugispora endophytica]|uniref:DUF3054 family protein n=1 Tax=Actinorugispora endophytica TaxID=1605990 RepID=A0A4R6V3C7_9ACTN|nr:DUF3054 domain-containing protein [Actinorugispora endophytica]TDQ54771.1 DUF3054 family protein [Actinorugispora endophytica]
MRSLWALLADAAVVLLFVLIGRSSHDEGNALLGVAATLWPFAAALALGWLATRAWRAPAAPVRTGLGLWAVTVIGAMALRAVSGAGTAVSFIVVTTLFLGAGLLGWRAVASWVLSRRAGSAAR